MRSNLVSSDLKSSKIRCKLACRRNFELGTPHTLIIGEDMSRIISLTNQKGGVGKTTTAINLAAALGEAGQRILIIDFDPQANSSSGLLADISRINRTVYDLLCKSTKIDDCIIRDVAENLDILPADINLSGAEVELLDTDNAQTALKEAIKSIRKNYNYIFIDCPPSIGTLTVNALAASDGVIIPVQCEYYALEGLGQVLNTIELVRQRLNKKLKIDGVLFTMYDSRTNLSDQVIESVKANLNEKILRTVIPRNVRLAEAPSHGEPITVYDSSSRGAESYRLLAAEILEG